MINDLSFNIESPVVWFLADYAVRVAVIAMCLVLTSPQSLRLVRPPSVMEAAGWVGILVVFSFTADHLLRRALPGGGLWVYPSIDGLAPLIIDTAIGIPLVALSEELVARGLFLAWAERRGWSPGATLIGSAALFASFHWSLGAASIVSAFLFGGIAMFSLLITRSVWLAIIAHWIADLLLFSLPSWLNSGQ